MILNAMYYNDTLKYKYLYNTISSVNTFRVFFKSYLDSSFTLIDDEKIGKKDLFTTKAFKDKIIK